MRNLLQIIYLPQFDFLQFSRWVTAPRLWLCTQFLMFPRWTSQCEILEETELSLSFQWMIQFPLILALSGARIFLANTTCSLSLGSDARQLTEGEILEENKLVSEKRLFIFQTQFVFLQLSLSVPGKHHKTDYNGHNLFCCYPALEM